MEGEDLRAVGAEAVIAAARAAVVDRVVVGDRVVPVAGVAMAIAAVGGIAIASRRAATSG